VPSLPLLEATAKRTTFSLAFVQNSSGLLATQRSPVVMHSAGGSAKTRRRHRRVDRSSVRGLFLRKVGWDVSIHERAGEELGSRGAGIATHTTCTKRSLSPPSRVANRRRNDTGGEWAFYESLDAKAYPARPRVSLTSLLCLAGRKARRNT
jgi:hypothetical protein